MSDEPEYYLCFGDEPSHMKIFRCQFRTFNLCFERLKKDRTEIDFNRLELTEDAVENGDDHFKCGTSTVLVVQEAAGDTQ